MYIRVEPYHVIHTVRAANCLHGCCTAFIETDIEILFSINWQVFIFLFLSTSIRGRGRTIIDEVDEILEEPVDSTISSPVDYHQRQVSHISVTGYVNPGILSNGAPEK